MLTGRTFTLAPPPAVVFGAGASRDLAPHVLATGHQRAFVVADPGVVAAGLLSPITESLVAAGIEVEVFSDVDPNPTDRNVAAGLEALRAFGDAAVVLVGGGSAMDCGKYLALAAPNGTEGLAHCFHTAADDDGNFDFSTLATAVVPERDGYPTVAVPTTSGTASETNGGDLITDTTDGRKLTFNSDTVKPRTVVLDPELTVGLPPVPTATCGMDALTHAIECFVSQAANPFADGLALRTIETVTEWLPRVMDDPADLEGRSQMIVAAHLAGVAFSSGPLLGLVHATGHPLSARLHVAHGQTLSTMLPHVMAFNLDVCEDRYARVARAMGADTPGQPPREAALAAIEAVRALSARVGTDKTITELGGTADDIDQLTMDALGDLIILTTPRYPSKAEVRELYLAAL